MIGQSNVKKFIIFDLFIKFMNGDPSCHFNVASIVLLYYENEAY